jgi:PAS domain S-box-containing protein
VSGIRDRVPGIRKNRDQVSGIRMKNLFLTPDYRPPAPDNRRKTMQLDIRTLALMVVAISFTLSIVMIFILQTRKTYPGFGLWTAGNTFFAVGFLLVTLRGSIPDVLSVVIANLVFLVSTLLYYEGVRSFCGMTSRKAVYFFLVLFIVILQSYFTFIQNDVGIRIIIVSLFLGISFGMVAMELFRNIEPDLRSTYWFTGSFFAGISFFMFLRAVITYFNPSPSDFFSPSQIQSATFITAGILGVAWTIGFINMNSNRLESELKSVNDESTKLFEFAHQSRRNLVRVMDDLKLTEKFKSIRLSLYEFSVTHSLEELLKKTLDEVCELTGSPIGFYHFVEADQKTLTLQAWSTRTVNEFCKAEGKGLHYGIDKAGVWVDCVHEKKPVIHNDYASLPHRKGMPEGHAPVIRELVVPIIRSDKVLAILGIGNKAEDYNEKDIEIVSYLADVAWVIAEHKHAEQEIRRQGDLLRKIFDILPVGLWFADKNGKLLKGNPAGVKIWGAEPKVAPGEYGIFKARRLPSGEEIAPDDWALGHTIREGVTIKDEMLEIDTFDGNKKIILNYTAPVMGDDGIIDGAIVINSDITERMVAEEKMLAAQAETLKLLEAAEKSRRVLLSVVEDQKRVQEEIRRLNEELERRVAERTASLEAANKELEAFSYSVSHDLRSPLQHVTGFAELLNKRATESLDDKSKHYLKVITESTVRMGRLIDDLLSFSRMGRTEMMKRKINPGDLLNEVLKEFQIVIKGRSIDWKIGRLPEVYGDSAMLRQVFVNLVSNALKYTGKCEKAVIEIGSIYGEKDEICFFVKDNGAGFDMKYVDKLFGLFQRLHRAEEYEGTGVGLANIRRIIHRHGGKVWAEGEVGKGATFWFTLRREA